MRHCRHRVIATPFASTLTRQVWLATCRVWLDRLIGPLKGSVHIHMSKEEGVVIYRCAITKDLHLESLRDYCVISHTIFLIRKMTRIFLFLEVESSGFLHYMHVSYIDTGIKKTVLYLQNLKILVISYFFFRIKMCATPVAHNVNTQYQMHVITTFSVHISALSWTRWSFILMLIMLSNISYYNFSNCIS